MIRASGSRRDRHGAPPLAQAAEGFIDDDARQPGAQGSVATKRRQSGKGSDIGLLDNVLTPDQMKATSFTYELGAEIPEAKWEDLGLWK